MVNRITVLGGSTPFTLALFQALKEAFANLPDLDICLVGRDAGALQAVRDFGLRYLRATGWDVNATTSLEDGLDGAEIVLHQIRYGSMAGRLADERLCQDFGLASDETLGLGGLNALLRTSQSMRPVTETLARVCPESWIVNLTNPLSAVATLMHKSYGLQKCLGVCELPLATIEDVAAVLEVPLADLQWSYSGLNHRGFLHDLTLEGRDVLADFVSLVPGEEFRGIKKSWIEELHAVPLKYYKLLRQGPGAAVAGRAEFLSNLRNSILSDLAKTPNQLPTRLTQRQMPWYRQAVVPMIQALIGSQDCELIATVPGDGDVALEKKILLGPTGIRDVAHKTPPAPVCDVLRLLLKHEELAVRAAVSPSPHTIRAAIESDPMIPEHLTDQCCARLVRQWL